MRSIAITERPRSGGTSPTTGRQLVVVLSGQPDGSDALLLAQMSRHRARHLIAVEPQGGDPKAVRPSGTAAALHAWRQIGSEVGSACLGIVAEAGAATAAVGEILSHGLDDGTMPGAVVLLGYHANFFETCMLISRGGASGHPEARGMGALTRVSRRSASEYPPMLLFLPANDPLLAECSSTCRRLRAVGFDIHLEVVDRVTAACRTSCTLDLSLIDELDAFFDTHLEPCFPNLFQDAS